MTPLRHVLETIRSEICSRGCVDLLSQVLHGMYVHEYTSRRTRELGRYVSQLSTPASILPTYRYFQFQQETLVGLFYLRQTGYAHDIFSGAPPATCTSAKGRTGYAVGENPGSRLGSFSCSQAKSEHQRAPPAIYDNVPLCKPGTMQLDIRAMVYSVPTITKLPPKTKSNIYQQVTHTG